MYVVDGFGEFHGLGLECFEFLLEVGYLLHAILLLRPQTDQFGIKLVLDLLLFLQLLLEIILLALMPNFEIILELDALAFQYGEIMLVLGDQVPDLLLLLLEFLGVGLALLELLLVVVGQAVLVVDHLVAVGDPVQERLLVFFERCAFGQVPLLHLHLLHEVVEQQLRVNMAGTWMRLRNGYRSGSVRMRCTLWNYCYTCCSAALSVTGSSVSSRGA